MLDKIKNLNDEGFEEWYPKIIRDVNFKYSLNKRRMYKTKVKRAVYNAINKHTSELPEDRVKRFAEDFHMLRRVFFGPKYNGLIYRDKRAKYKFRPKEGEKFPEIRNIVELALYLGTNVNTILGYVYTQYPSKSGSYEKNEKEYNSPHYNRHFIKKPDGRKRLISEPKYKLKQMQKLILHDMLEKVLLEDCVTGFVPGKSVLDNARPHLTCNTLVKIDLRNFFPSLKLEYVLEVFRGMGYCKPVAGALACICTDLYRLQRAAAQGAPTSPMIGNLYAEHLDRRLKGLWEKHGFTYTRYADDLAFSSEEEDVRVGNLISATYEIIKDEGLYPNLSKTKVLRKGNRKVVTGIVVNEKLNLKREWIRTLRAEIHNYQQTGIPDGPEGIEARQQLEGKLAYLKMIRPEKAEKYMLEYEKI